jgi:hypothetical protein
MTKITLCEFEAERVVANDIDGEGEVLIYLPDEDEPVVLYLEYAEFVVDVLANHPGVDYEQHSDTDKNEK